MFVVSSSLGDIHFASERTLVLSHHQPLFCQEVFDLFYRILAPMEHSRPQRCIRRRLFKYLLEVTRLPGAAGCNDRYPNGLLDLVDEPEVEPAVRSVLVDAVEQYLAGPH